MTTESSVKRARDLTGNDIRTYLDNEGAHIQALGLADGDGNQITGENPLTVSIEEGSLVDISFEDLAERLDKVIRLLEITNFHLEIMTDTCINLDAVDKRN